jgi:hypothetical protein
MDVEDAWAGRAGSDGRAGCDGADIYEWWATRATGTVGCVGCVGCVAPVILRFWCTSRCLLVSVDECVCMGVGANDDVCG